MTVGPLVNEELTVKNSPNPSASKELNSLKCKCAKLPISMFHHKIDTRRRTLNNILSNHKCIKINLMIIQGNNTILVIKRAKTQWLSTELP